MRQLLTILLCLFALVSHAQFYKTGWTSTTNPATARAALGISETNATGIYVTNEFNTFTGDVFTIGSGSNAVTITASAGTLSSSNVSLSLPSVTASTSMTLGGVTITEWPEGGGGSTGIITNGTATQFYLSFSTNASPVSGLTNLGYFTNGFAYATWTSTNGDSLTMEYSTDGTNWTAASEYNAPAYLRVAVELANVSGGTAAVTNLSVWSVLNLDSLGYTNDYTLQTLRVAYPVSGSDAASKEYADGAALGAAKQWATHPAVSDVRLVNYNLRPDALWSLGRTVASNSPNVAFSFAGNELFTISPGFTGISNGVAITASNGVATITVATNNAPGPFRVLCSTNDMDWFTEISVTNSYPTASGTNYTLTFPAPTGPGSWIYQVGRSNAAGIILPANTPWDQYTNGTLNFVAETTYTNGTRRAWVAANVTLSPTATDFASAVLSIDQNADGTFEWHAKHFLPAGVGTNGTSVFHVGAFIQPGARFKFTKYTATPSIVIEGGTSAWIFP